MSSLQPDRYLTMTLSSMDWDSDIFSIFSDEEEDSGIGDRLFRRKVKILTTRLSICYVNIRVDTVFPI